MVKKIVFIGVLVVVVLAAANYNLVLDWFFDAKSINETEVRILLKEDPDVNSLLETLHGKKVIADIEEARAVAKEIGLQDDRLAGGKYVIAPKTNLKTLLSGFEMQADGRGKGEVLVNVFFNSCRDLNDVAMNISRCIAADSASLVDFMLKPETLQKYGFTAAQMPALIFPKQYEMEFDTDAEEFVAFMALQFREFWTPERMEKLKELGLNAPSQAVTLASIVYSEQGRVQEEWPIIARLYLNRLNDGMKLESDPTFKFCWGHELDGVQRLTTKHRDIVCDYNTYQIYGLPPGPICITPAKVVDAVLNPAEVDYIYMCAKSDFSGKHNFTKSYREHVNNANAYRKWLSEQL